MAGVLASVHRVGQLLVTRQSLPAFVAYLLMVFLAKHWIRRTRPLEFRKLLILYNGACSLLSVYSLFLFVSAYFSPQCSHFYQKSTTPEFRYAFLVYYVIKWLELLDTVFMILRHKQRQISFLHVYHHASMLLLSDLGYNDYPWAAIAFYTAVNSFIHVWLYLYYALSAAFPNDPPQWKRAMTQMQILQFFIGFVYSGYGYLHHGFCIYGPLYGITLTALFCNFYYHAYVKRRRPPGDREVLNGKTK